MQFYILNGSQQEGPLSADQVNDLLARGSINQSSLIWFEGLSEWAPIEKFSDLFPRSGPTQFPTSNKAASANLIKTKESSPKWKKVVFGVNHPWRRYFARFVDFYIFGLWWFVIFGLLLEKASPELHKHLVFIVKEGIFDGPLGLLIWMPIEVALISLFGTTPGKLLFGICVKDQNGNNLTILDSLRRYIKLVVSGLACGFPILLYLANLWACKRLESEGTTSWDNGAGSVVVHSEKNSWRYFFGTIGVLLAFSSIMMFHM
jgi:hypothetical protein